MHKRACACIYERHPHCRNSRQIQPVFPSFSLSLTPLVHPFPLNLPLKSALRLSPPQGERKRKLVQNPGAELQTSRSPRSMAAHVLVEKRAREKDEAVVSSFTSKTHGKKMNSLSQSPCAPPPLSSPFGLTRLCNQPARDQRRRRRFGFPLRTTARPPVHFRAKDYQLFSTSLYLQLFPIHSEGFCASGQKTGEGESEGWR